MFYQEPPPEPPPPPPPEKEPPPLPEDGEELIVLPMLFAMLLTESTMRVVPELPKLWISDEYQSGSVLAIDANLFAYTAVTPSANANARLR